MASIHVPRRVKFLNPRGTADGREPRGSVAGATEKTKPSSADCGGSPFFAHRRPLAAIGRGVYGNRRYSYGPGGFSYIDRRCSYDPGRCSYVDRRFSYGPGRCSYVGRRCSYGHRDRSYDVKCPTRPIFRLNGPVFRSNGPVSRGNGPVFHRSAVIWRCQTGVAEGMRTAGAERESVEIGSPMRSPFVALRFLRVSGPPTYHARATPRATHRKNQLGPEGALNLPPLDAPPLQGSMGIGKPGTHCDALG